MCVVNSTTAIIENNIDIQIVCQGVQDELNAELALPL
jgi:hypothetical protein